MNAAFRCTRCRPAASMGASAGGEQTQDAFVLKSAHRQMFFEFRPMSTRAQNGGNWNRHMVPMLTEV